MSFETIWFIRAALIYLGAGVSFGLLMAIRPDWVFILKPIHTHLNLLGFLAMFVYGVAYHTVPRFRGRQIYSQKLACYHLILSNVALVGMSVSFGLFYTLGAIGTLGLEIFGTMQVIAVGLFIFNLWKSME